MQRNRARRIYYSHLRQTIMVLSPPISQDINLKRELHIVADITTSFPIQLLAVWKCF